jgi:O-antigen/teichoic acid export membrane protein
LGASVALEEGVAACTSHPSRTFVRHVTLFSFANLLALICNGVLTFLLPRLLSMESYGYYRLFILYGGFAGILHLGLLDGALIRWAARPQTRMSAELTSSLAFLLTAHAVILVPVTAILAIFFRHQPWFFLVSSLALYAVIFNVSALSQFALQAGKLFGMLSFVTVLTPALLLLAVLLLRYWCHLSIGSVIIAYIVSWLAAALPAWVLLLRRFPMKGIHVDQALRVGLYNIRTGWSVLVALLLTNIALSLDRIVVSLSFGIRDFAVYSLAATALAVVNTIILSVSRVVFPYLSDGLSAEGQARAYWFGEACLVTLWAISLVGYFPFHWLIVRLLPNYTSSLPVLRVLMVGTGFTAIIHILQSNYFRSKLRLTHLLLGCVVGSVTALTMLLLARHTGRLSLMALAMLVALALWWMVNEHLLRSLTGGGPGKLTRTAVVYGTCALWFVYCSSWSNPTFAALAYLLAPLMVIFLCYRSVLRTAPGLQWLPTIGWRAGGAE